MNKEVIYLEPEDDITDILTKLQQAEQKLVVLVPPKKATILRSAVNMKLIAKATKETKKVAVIVTQDPGIMKLAMGSHIMVAKTLQSRPAVPTEEDFKDLISKTEGDEIVDDGLGTATVGDALKNLKNPDEKATAENRSSGRGSSTDGEDPEGERKSAKNGQKDAQKGKKGSSDKNTSKFAKYRKQIIFGTIGVIAVVAILVWALVLAPAVSIVVAIRATSTNFAETVSFTEDAAAETVEEGKFFAQKQVFEQKQSREFKATGSEDRGAKATGKIEVSFSFKPIDYYDEKEYIASVPAGTVFTSGSKEYVATASVSNSWDGTDSNAKKALTCEEGTLSSVSAIKRASKCTFVLNVNVEAAAAGEDYDLPAGSTWDTTENATVANSSAISGGSTDLVTVVSQSDIDAARASLQEDAASEEEGKERLYKQLGDDVIVIKDSYKYEPGDAVSTPAVGIEPAEGVTPKVEMTSVFYVYTVDKAKVEEFIKVKTNLTNDQKIYSYGEPYFEKFVDINSSARLKTVIETGPTVTEESIMEKARGRKIGEVQSLLRSINGVNQVDITPSFFWVNSVPDDTNKVTIELKTEEADKS